MKQSKTKEFSPKLRGKIKAKWEKLSERDIIDIGRSAKALSAKIQKAYGRNKKSADQEISEFRKLLAAKSPATSAATVQ